MERLRCGHDKLFNKYTCHCNLDLYTNNDYCRCINRRKISESVCYLDVNIIYIHRSINMAEPYKRKIEKEEDIIEDGDFVLDGYSIHLDKNVAKHNDDLEQDINDYEDIQEEYAVQSEDTQPIAVDRFISRSGKSRRSSR